MSSQVEYHRLPLLNSDQSEDRDSRSEDVSSHYRHKSRHLYSKTELAVFVLSLVINLIAMGWIIEDTLSPDRWLLWRGTRPQWTPVERLITHEPRPLPALLDRSPYHGPPDDEIDVRWKDLYRDLIHIMPASQLGSLPNATFVFPPPDKDRALLQLNIFHVLHCLNTVRKFAHPERYPEIIAGRFQFVGKDRIELDHVDHCINAVRQSLMCNADISPDVWQSRRDPKTGHNISEIHFNSLHTCRNYNVIQKWAHERTPKAMPGVHPNAYAGILDPLD